MAYCERCQRLHGERGTLRWTPQGSEIDDWFCCKGAPKGFSDGARQRSEGGSQLGEPGKASGCQQIQETDRMPGVLGIKWDLGSDCSTVTVKLMALR